ncbi:hypothetical protein NC652_037223 [Populus alba x Populus x berolinensis]|nr:hypothetical protein NC652_037223 [Populus alba x Populus x berolinensis]
MLRKGNCLCLIFRFVQLCVIVCSFAFIDSPGIRTLPGLFSLSSNPVLGEVQLKKYLIRVRSRKSALSIQASGVFNARLSSLCTRTGAAHI